MTKIRYVILAVVAVIWAVTLTAPIAAAAAAPVGPDSTADSVLSLDPFTVSLIFGTLVPIIGGVILKTTSTNTVKVLVNLVLSTIASVINVSTTEGGFVVISEDVLKSTALTFVISVATLYGVWQPTGVDAKLKTEVGRTE